MWLHLMALKAHLDAVGDAFYESDMDDTPLRQAIGELAMKLKTKIEQRHEARDEDES